MKRLKALRLAVIALVASSAPRFAEACAVCFSGVGKDMSRGFFWGILILGLLPFMLIALFVGVIANATRKKQQLQ